MIDSPLAIAPVFHLGPVPITQPVIATWIIMALMSLFSIVLTRRLKLRPGKIQATVELVTGAIDQQIGEVVRADPAPYRALIGTIFLFIFIADWSSLIPGVEPPTAHVETDAALALIVFAATLYHGVRCNGLVGYLKTFAQPSWVMIPLNLVEQITRTFSLFVRLFGNIMSGVFVIGIVLSLAGLLVPIPLMALDLLTGAVQAYIFAILACVFIGSAVSEGQAARAPAAAPDPSQARSNP
ncbi:ATP synthase F0 subunit A [Novosphingobium sp. PC22D]|uniref:F0F1 ATP synthase subunit A n=1 Tax=Novosphingobium sp. PC22D TaxID=1962403 RepID=UPI000BF02F76|nr:F0F1 ATP synthase subunit A [Novosphingobium sp. PC22D]PEQ11594.1 ATP synthase F0 subunit A [Novosphingobium sp. PC22D]